MEKPELSLYTDEELYWAIHQYEQMRNEVSNSETEEIPVT